MHPSGGFSRWLILLSISCLSVACGIAGEAGLRDRVRTLDRQRVLAAAEQALLIAPVTVTATRSPRSAGGIHDYFSEGDYWWQDPGNPEGPYIRRDGMTNPDNFVGHRHSLMQFGVQLATLTAAYRLTDDRRFADFAVRHLKAWCVDEATRMNPHVLYAQAIRGRVTGRGIGIIDAIHLIEVARSVDFLEHSSALVPADAVAIKRWFADFLLWITTHPYGVEEREAKNNHGTWWVAQVAAFARLTGDTATEAFCRKRFKEVLLPGQMAADGSFPLELERTKPYGYSLFNLEGMAVICKLLSTTQDNLWTFTLPDGRTMSRGIAYMLPFIIDKKSWPHPPDVMHFEELPIRHATLLFATEALGDERCFSAWQSLPGDPTSEEAIRSMPVRQPVLWIEQ